MEIKSFCLGLIFTLTITFLIHISLLKFTANNLWDDMIIQAYLFNTFITAIIYFILHYNLKKRSIYIAWIFLLGSLVKFSVFFIFFHPFLSSDGIIENLEFFSFFIPYSVSLIFETYSFMMLLKLVMM